MYKLIDSKAKAQAFVRVGDTGGNQPINFEQRVAWDGLSLRVKFWSIFTNKIKGEP